MELPDVIHLPPEICFARHPIEVVMTVEPFEAGDAEEGVSGLHTTAKVTQETEEITTWEFPV